MFGGQCGHDEGIMSCALMPASCKAMTAVLEIPESFMGHCRAHAGGVSRIILLHPPMYLY